MLNTMLSALAVALTLTLGGLMAPTPEAAAERPVMDAAKDADAVAAGSIVEINHDAHAFVLKLADGAKVSVTYDENTRFTLNGEASDAEALEEDLMATVTQADGVATHVAITEQ